MARIDEVIDILKARLEQARQAKRTFAADPAMADKVAVLLARAPIFSAVSGRGKRLAESSAWQRIHEFFRGTGNEWITITDLAENIGAPRGAVAQALYQGHAKDMESKAAGGFMRAKLWRLKQGGEKNPGPS